MPMGNTATQPPAFGGMQVDTGLVTLQSAADHKAQHLGNGYYALDSLGAVCPFPLLEAKDAMASLESGQHLVIDFDCTQGTETIPQWAVVDGHEYTVIRYTGDVSCQFNCENDGAA